MKNQTSKQQPRKQKTSYIPKRNSDGISLISKQISTQMQHIYNKRKKSHQPHPLEKTLTHNLMETYNINADRFYHQNKNMIHSHTIQQNRRNDLDKIAVNANGLKIIKKKNSNADIPNEKLELKDNYVKKEAQQKDAPKQNKILSIQRKHFTYHYIIGKGGFGKVWKVQHQKLRNFFALKQMLKSLVMTKKSVQSVMNERLLLADLNSPFIVNMHYSFQDRDTLYLVLDLMEGGDLRHHIGNRNFNEIQAKFFIACIVLGLEYLHTKKIIHRDIKPQNLVLDSRGYIRITDLGIAKLYKANNSSDTSGTPGYMSPEVICRQNHSFVSDFFALGVIAYELMTNKRPYHGKTRNQIRQQMLSKQASIKYNSIPDDWSSEAVDFINKLIQRKPQNRLGFHGISQIKNHPWIKDINWKKLYNKQIQSPFIPCMKKNNFDQDDQITIQDQQQAQLIEKNSLLLRKPEFQQLFKNYNCEGKQKQTNNKKQRYSGKSYVNQNSIEKKMNTINTNSSKNNSMKNSKQYIYPKNNLQTMQTMTKQQLKRNTINIAADKKFFKEFRF